MNLLQLREKQGQSAWKDLASAVETSENYIVQLAHGHRNPSPKMVDRLVVASGGELTREGLRPDIYGPVETRVA